MRYHECMMRYIVGLLVLGTVAGPLKAQSNPIVGPDRRVWVQTLTPSGSLDWETKMKGTPEQTLGDTLLIRPVGGGSPVRVVLTDHTQVRLYEGRRSSVGRGAVIGLGLGAVAGAIIGAVSFTDSPFQRGALDFSQGSDAAAGAIVFGLGGLLAGAIVGAFITHEVWSRPMGFSAARPLIMATGHGVGIGLSLTF